MNSQRCRVRNGALSPAIGHAEPPAVTSFVHDSFRAMVLNEQFSCVAGRSAVGRDAYGFGLYERMDDEASAAQLASDLEWFVSDPELSREPLRAFVASFVEPATTQEGQFENLLWATLQHLNEGDTDLWAAGCDANPESPDFAFSFAATGFFVIGMHAGSSRYARRFAWPTLVFNPHEQFDELRAQGRFVRFQGVIRSRDTDLQGSINPMLADFGEESEARQYSGREVEKDWNCPFHARNGTSSSGPGK